MSGGFSRVSGVYLRGEVAVQQTADAVLVLPREAETAIVLRDTALFIWNELLRRDSLGEVADALVERFEVPAATVETAVGNLVDELVELGVLRQEEGGSPVVNILCVCSGNICRSLYAARFLEQQFMGTGVVVRSAGTEAFHQHSVPPEIHDLLVRNGLNAEPHEPTPLGPGLINWADLILTATATHRMIVLRESPMAFRKTFTILEAAAAAKSLLEEDETEDVKDRVKLLSGARTLIQSGTPLDLPDPFRRGPQEYETMEQRISPALRVIAEYLQSDRSVSGGTHVCP